MIEFEIRSEMNVREWFTANGGKFGYSIVVSQTAFPDYILKDEQGRLYRVEVEYQSFNFVQHKHDPAGCDFILCWHHTSASMLPVLELSTGNMYLPNEEPLNPINDGKKGQAEIERNNKERAKEAIAKIDGLKDEFFTAYINDMRAVSEYQKALYEPRIRLQGVARKTIHALNSNHVRVYSEDPYDLFKYLFS
ncbi:MAG TPA: hypothetical protein VLA24_17850 [Pseudomonadales bacterium]|nr:hypothetical protein [Pseudomonadales bacterium]